MNHTQPNPQHNRKSAKRRTSTQYSMVVGTSLVVIGVTVSVFAIYTKAITGESIVSLVWAQYISAAAFFGVNLTRVAAENMSGVGDYSNTGTHGNYGGVGNGGYSGNTPMPAPSTTLDPINNPPVGFPQDGNEEGPPMPEGQPTHPSGAPVGTLDFKPPGE